MIKKYQGFSVLALMTFMSATVASTALAMTPEEKMAAQQDQIDKQAQEIAELKKQVQLLLEMSGKNEKMLAEKVDKAEIEDLKADQLVVSGNSKAKVTLYGQVNRAGLWTNDGDSSEFYFVDNDNSSTRMGVEAAAKLSGGQGLGAKIEYELESNASSVVSQLEQDTDAEIKLRHADLWFESDFGKLAIGRGSTASDGTAETDLSGTTVVTYSSIGDMAGGQLWYDNARDSLGEVEIGDVFDNMDGLGRRDRFRYDSPSFAGITLSGSVIEDEAYDLAARYAREYENLGLTVAAAVGWADGGRLRSYDDQYSGSFSVLHASGINVSLSAGKQKFSEGGKADPTYWYGKLGYQTKFFDFGKSAFSIDYGSFEDIDSNGNESEAFSIAFVQKIDDWASELYFAYRQHSLSSTGFDYDDIGALMFGARVKF